MKENLKEKEAKEKESSILTICPTRQRVKKCQKMIESFFETKHISDIVIITDEDDPDFWQYMEIKNTNIIWSINKAKGATTTELLNKIFKQFNYYDYYHLTNDDFVYKTPSWDSLFLAKLQFKQGGIAYGNDLCGGSILPTAPFLSGDIARALGWIQMPNLTHLCGDMVWRAIGSELNKLYYMPEIIIEHQHPLKSPNIEKDETHLKTNSFEMFRKDNTAFAEWVLQTYPDDLKKVKKALGID